MAKSELNPLDYRLILLAGDYASMRKSKLDEILRLADLHEPDAFDRESIISSEKPFAEWVSAAATTPFMSDRRAVIVRNISRVKTEDAAESLRLSELKNLPPSALLILVADEEAKAADSRETQGDPLAAWKKVVKENDGLTIVSNMPDKKNVRSVQSVAQAAGKKIGNQALNALVEMVGFRADRAEEELEKLVLYVGDAREITIQDVKNCVTPEPEHNIFQMCDSLWVGDATRAIKEMNRLRGQSRDFSTEARRIIPFIVNQVRTLWQAKSFHEDGAGVWELKEKPLSKMHEFPQGKAKDMARRLSYEQLQGFMLALRSANAQLSAGAEGRKPEEVIEFLILTMCDIARSRKSA